MPQNTNHKKLALGAGYQTLVKQVRGELEKLELFVRTRTGQSYWRVGKFVHCHILENKDRGDYGKFVRKT